MVMAVIYPFLSKTYPKGQLREDKCFPYKIKLGLQYHIHMSISPLITFEEVHEFSRN
jgi:hypothetical protein